MFEDSYISLRDNVRRQPGQLPEIKVHNKRLVESVILSSRELKELEHGVPSPGVFDIDTHRSKLDPPLSIATKGRIGLKPIFTNYNMSPSLSKQQVEFPSDASKMVLMPA